MHARALTKACELVPKDSRNGLRKGFDNYATSFQNAVKAKSRPWLTSLSKLAKRKAEIIEDGIFATRRAHWRQVIGAAVEGGVSAAARPTKAAYRYIRQTEGWITSPIGKVALNNAVDGEEANPQLTYGEQHDTFDEISTFVPDDAGVIYAPLCEQANVDQQTEEWAELW